MRDENYVKRLGQLYEEVLKNRCNDDYIINQSQFSKLMDVLSFFHDVVDNGNIEPLELEPKAKCGGITATFTLFDITGDDIQKFCNVMRHASALGIDATLNNKICISVTVPNVFIPSRGKIL